MDLGDRLEAISPGCRGRWDIEGSEGHGTLKMWSKFVFL